MQELRTHLYIEHAIERKEQIYTNDNTSTQISSAKQTYVSLKTKVKRKSHNSRSIQGSEQWNPKTPESKTQYAHKPPKETTKYFKKKMKETG